MSTGKHYLSSRHRMAAMRCALGDPSAPAVSAIPRRKRGLTPEN